MGSKIGYLVLIILYLLVVSSGRKKKGGKRKGRREAKRAQRSTDFGGAFAGRATAASASAVQEKPDRRADDQEESDCERSRIHLHEVSQQQMDGAGEGEDPCHRGSAAVADTPDDFSYDEEEKERSAFAQDVLRGVIMSEILTRPCKRTAGQRNGRSIR